MHDGVDEIEAIVPHARLHVLRIVEVVVQLRAIERNAIAL